MTFLPHLDYLKNPNIVWFNPCWGYYGFQKRLAEFQQGRGVDFQTTWLHRDMKRNKEIYATAMAALCIQQDMPTKHRWWFTKPPQDPPDGLIGTPIEDKNQKANIMHGREVEVVEYLDGSLLETIKNKLSRKSYEPNTILVCLLSPQIRDSISVFNFKSIAEQIKQFSLPLAHIFLVGHGFQLKSSFQNLTREEQIEKMLKIFFIQLLPTYTTMNISPHTCCRAFQAGKEEAWLKFRKLGRGTGFEKVTVEEPPKLFD